MSRSNVYLVAAKQTDGDMGGYDNTGYQEQKVAYSNANGVDMQESQKVMPDRPYRGMGKDELLHFSSQPFWRRLRMVCISIVLIGWLALIITVVALVLVYPRCRDPGSRSWWQTEGVYRIYVPSFKDSNGDGIGDLKGIESKLDYIQALGFNIVSLSPFYSGDTTDTSTSNADFKSGDDTAITDHKQVGAVYGSLTDFDNLVDKAHEKGMYVILDFVPNHTGTSHPWFTSSAGNAAGVMRNYYVWAGNGATEPNNWINMYDTSAWTKDTTRDEWYLHQFASGTADLNLRSALVRQELEDILRFWLDRDVNGFNVRDAAYLYEDFDLRDDGQKPGTTWKLYADLDHVHTSGQTEVYGIMEEWKTVINMHNKTKTQKLLMADIDGGLDASRLYSDCDRSGVQMPLNRNALGLVSTCNGQCIADYVDGWMGGVPSGKWANWLMGDEDADRVATRFNSSFSSAFAILTYLLPGTPVMYYGDELGTIDTGVSVNAWSRAQPQRAIMPWGNSSGGFCGNCTSMWTDVGDVKAQGAISSLIHELVTLRAENSFRFGDYAIALRDTSVVSFVREFDGETGYLVAVNFGPDTVTRDFTGSHDTIPTEGTIALSHGADYEVDDDADPTSLEIGAYGGVVVSWDYVAKEL